MCIGLKSVFDEAIRAALNKRPTQQQAKCCIVQ